MGVRKDEIIAEIREVEGIQKVEGIRKVEGIKVGGGAVEGVKKEAVDREEIKNLNIICKLFEKAAGTIIEIVCCLLIILAFLSFEILLLFNIELLF